MLSMSQTAEEARFQSRLGRCGHPLRRRLGQCRCQPQRDAASQPPALGALPMRTLLGTALTMWAPS